MSRIPVHTTESVPRAASQRISRVTNRDQHVPAEVLSGIAEQAGGLLWNPDEAHGRWPNWDHKIKLGGSSHT